MVREEKIMNTLRKTLILSTILTLIIILSISLISHVYAQSLETNNPPPASTDPKSTAGEWQYDPSVTELGKNAERARQLVFWVFSHEPVHSAPVLAQMWGFSRNMAYVFVLFTIIFLALHLVLSQKNIGPVFSGISLGYDINLNLQKIVFRIVAVLIFITFSYMLVRG
ncbi:hypothetical protein HY468_00375, partial [Candidatus Roizmanbacteria bacterium]|nr:hypothetical protein [Candidatus Roizmanbacteria bacterium]